MPMPHNVKGARHSIVTVIDELFTVPCEFHTLQQQQQRSTCAGLSVVWCGVFMIGCLVQPQLFP